MKNWLNATKNMLSVIQACPILSIEIFQQLHLTAGNISLLRKIVYRTVAINYVRYRELEKTLMKFNGMSRVE